MKERTAQGVEVEENEWGKGGFSLLLVSQCSGLLEINSKLY